MQRSNERQKGNNAPAFVVKISGPSVAFMDDIISMLKNAYTVVVVSKPKRNDEDAGYHIFLTIVDLRSNENIPRASEAAE